MHPTQTTIEAITAITIETEETITTETRATETHGTTTATITGITTEITTGTGTPEIAEIIEATAVTTTELIVAVVIEIGTAIEIMATAAVA
jgi:hypothetical protein